MHEKMDVIDKRHKLIQRRWIENWGEVDLDIHISIRLRMDRLQVPSMNGTYEGTAASGEGKKGWSIV